MRLMVPLTKPDRRQVHQRNDMKIMKGMKDMKETLQFFGNPF